MDSIEQELKFVQDKLVDSIQVQCGLLQMMSLDQLHSLLRRCEELQIHGEPTLRMSAIINGAAATIEIERRK